MSREKLQIVNNILERLKSAYNLKTDAALADRLGIVASTLSNWKARVSIDYDLIFSKCEDLNEAWILTGEGQMKKSEEKPLQIAEERVIYNNVAADPELAEIVRMLKEYPQDKKLVLKLLKIKKDMGAGFAGIEVKNILKEEG